MCLSYVSVCQNFEFPIASRQSGVSDDRGQWQVVMKGDGTQKAGALSDAERLRAGIRQVAEEAGVSVASVSRTLNKPETVSKGMQQRVQAAIERLGYVPNSAARARSLQRTHAIGAIVPTLDYSIFARFIEALIPCSAATVDGLLPAIRPCTSMDTSP